MLSLQRTGFLLSALCERFELCLPPEARRHLLDQAPSDAASFTAAVFAAQPRGVASAGGAVYQDALALVERAYDDQRRLGG